MSKKLLLTGATGYLGSHITELLLSSPMSKNLKIIGTTKGSSQARIKQFKEHVVKDNHSKFELVQADMAKDKWLN